MQEAKINSYGELVVIRNGKERTAYCRPGGMAEMEYGTCSHDCPGWEEKDMIELPDWEIEHGLFVTLCSAMGKTYKIVEDGRVK